MTSLCLLKSQFKNQQIQINPNQIDDKIIQSLPQTRKSLNKNPPDLLEIQTQQKQVVSKPRSISYNISRNASKQRKKSGDTLDGSEGSVDNSITVGKSAYSKYKNRRQTYMMTGEEFESKKLQIIDLDLTQKMDILKRLCNLKAVKTDKDIQLIYEILKENQYIKYLKDTKGELFILSKVCPHIKIINKRQGEIIYEQDRISQGFYVVIHGECEGRMKNYSTGEFRLITDKYVEGTEFGNIEMLDQKTRIQTIISKTDTWLIHFDTNTQKQYFAALQRIQLEYLIDMLNLFPCFQNYGKRNLLNFLPFFTFQVYNRNQKVYSSQQPSDYIYFIVSGDFKVFQKVNMNSDMTLDQLLKLPSRLITEEKDKYFRQIEVSLLGQGSIFGEEEIILQEEFRKQEVLCSSTSGQVLLLHKEDFAFKFANDQYFSEIFRSLVSSKRQFREQRLKEIENISKATINTNEQNYNKNVIGKKIKLKLEDRVLDLQKKGLIKQKLENQLYEQQQQQENFSSRNSSPSQTARRQNAGSPVPTQSKKKARTDTKSPSSSKRKQEQFGNSQFLNLDKTNTHKGESKLHTLNSFNDYHIVQFDNSAQDLKNSIVGREIIPTSLILKGGDHQINIFTDSSRQFNSSQRSPKESNRSPKFQNPPRLKSIGSTEQLNSSQNLWISNQKELSSTLNLKSKKLKNTLDKSDFYGTQQDDENPQRCETSPSRKRTKMSTKNSIQDNKLTNDQQKSTAIPSERSQKLNVYKQYRSKSNQSEANTQIDPLFMASSRIGVDQNMEKTLQSMFYNNQVNLQQFSPPNRNENKYLLSSSENSLQEEELNRDSKEENESKSSEIKQSLQKSKNQLTIIRSPQDEPSKIYDPTGINKYLRRIFYGKARKKHYTEYEEEQQQQPEDRFNKTQRSQTTERRTSPERRNASLEEKMIRQFRSNKRETQLKASFQQVMKVVDKKNLKVHLYKKNLIKNAGDKDKYNQFIKPQGIKKDFLCFEYVNQRLTSQNSEEENYQKYAQMVQLEYQKFKQQNNEMFEQIREESLTDFNFQTASLADELQTINTQQNQPLNDSNLKCSQLHNVKGSSYSKKRKILKIISDPNTKKVIVLNANKFNETSFMQQTSNNFQNQQQLKSQKNQYKNKLAISQCNNLAFPIHNQDEQLQLNELLKTKDIVPNCFIPYSQEPHFKRLQQHKLAQHKLNNSDGKKQFQNHQQQQQLQVEYMEEQIRLSPFSYRLSTLDK